jgi:putative SOS response-associated peptidase YedK
VCYFSSISVGFKIIEDRFGARFVQTEAYAPVYSANAFTFPSLPVITADDPGHIQLFQWGLIPFWVKDFEAAAAIRSQTLNARAETVFEKPAFRHLISSRRCLVLVDGFFEWRHIGKRTFPYYIRLKDRAPFALAGIWDNWKNPATGERLRTFAVITTRANTLLEKIHNTRKRMPVILPADRERHWLQSDLDREGLEGLLLPFDEAEMEAYPVSNLINKLGCNTANIEVTRRQDYPDLPDL